MEWQLKEDIIVQFITTIFDQILQENSALSIKVASRAGAEISDFLEDKFVAIAQHKENIVEVQGSPKGKTKNPYDISFKYKFSSHEEELVWIDIKAINTTYKDSNPDMGTYKKFLDFFKKGNYFVIYCQLAYTSTNTGLRFVETKQGKMVNVFLLKDINHTFRIQPNNQLQVNYKALPEKRTLIDFIELLENKVQESIARKRKKIEQEANQLETEFISVKESVQKTLFG